MGDRRATILQIIPELETGGAELATVEISQALVATGARAIVLSQGGRLAPRLAACGGEFIAFPAATKNPLQIVRNARAIARLVETEGIDLIHARSRAPAWSALIAARRTGKPFVVTYHGAYSEKGRLKRLYNSVMARGDIVIANSRYTADLIRSRYATPPGRLRIIYRGVDLDAFDPAKVAPERIAALRRNWGLKEADRVILQAARLTGWKGQSTVIAAARLLAGRGQLGDGVVIMAGDAQGRSEYVERLRTEIAAGGLEDRVRLVGHVEDMPAAFAAAHLAIVASTEPEAFGRTGAEAQALGCPVIATAIGAPQETVLASPGVPADAATGWLVPPGDAASLADAIAAALALTREQRAAMGSRARAHVARSFSLATMKSETLAVYDELLGGRLNTGGRMLQTGPS